MAAKSGRCGVNADFDPGCQPRGNGRGTQSVYSCDQVPSAITASRPAFSAAISGWLSLDTAYATKLPKPKVYPAIEAVSPGRMTLVASIAGATQASIWWVFTLV